MNLSSAFRSSVENNFLKPAVFWGAEELAYDRLWAQSDYLASHLTEELGVKPGDRVAVWLKNCPEFIASVFGILGAGGVVVPVNSFLKPEEVGYILADAGVGVVITNRGMAAGLEKLGAAMSRVQCWLVDIFILLIGKRTCCW